ncbi:MAG: hydantoinase B/oxoprolinase family protein [Chloroflexi bacterium]|nr:hydantoinase B/oxoprolinase family protein [Chloroflexota bacterium]
MATRTIDPVTLEVVRNALLTITKEMEYVVGRTSRSNFWVETGDYSTAVLTADGLMVAQGPVGIPVHMGTMPSSVQHALDRIGRDNLQPGDIIWNNDPYSGSNHLPDVLLAQPIFDERRDLIAIAAVRGHWIDIGGATPCSYSTANRDIQAEGIRVPHTKICKAGVLNQELLDVILANVRMPRERYGDFRAQMAGCTMGEQRVQALCQRYGSDAIRECMEEILNHSERLMRAEISRMPDGEYTAYDYLDGDAIDQRPLRVQATVKIRGDSLEVDFTGTDGPATGGLNAPYAVTCTAVYYTLKAITDPEIPSNSGTYRPIRISVPENSLVNPKWPSPVVAGNHETSSRILDVLLQALAPVLPDRVVAGLAGSAYGVHLAGLDERRGLPGREYIMGEPIHGGRGACLGADGINAIRTGVVNIRNQPVEVMEMRTPLVIEAEEVVTDSGGPGRWRGGCASRRVYRLAQGKGILTIIADRESFGPFGLFGGQTGERCRLTMTSPQNERVLFSKFAGPMEQGEVLLVQAAGGGGYGDPLERDLESVRKDLKNGYVSVDAAGQDYGVVVDPRSGEVDLPATEKLRAKRRQGTQSVAQASI